MHNKSNLIQIGRALHEFESVHGHFPPAVIYGPDGRPWHSWRVLLLPYLRDSDEYDVDYDYAQPWDSERNRRVLKRTPAVYRDQMHGDVKGELTHYAEAEDDDAGQYTYYAAITGKGTAFPSVGRKMTDPRTLPLGGRDAGVSGVVDMLDGLSNIILVGPVGPGRKIPWTKPEDLAFGPDFPAPGDPGGFGGPYMKKDEEGGDAVAYAHLLFGDGVVRDFPRRLMLHSSGS